MKALKFTALSALIRQAVNDVHKTLQDQRYTLNMYKWHEPLKTMLGFKRNTPRPSCAVCLAGAVLAQSCAMPLDMDYVVSDSGDFIEIDNELGAETVACLYAIDACRTGQVFYALKKLTPFADAAMLKRMRAIMVRITREDSPRKLVDCCREAGGLSDGDNLPALLEAQEKIAKELETLGL